VRRGDPLVTGPLGDATIRGYLDSLAAAVPVPGGGAVAGVTLAQANALGSMVVSYAIGKPKFVAHEPAHRAALECFDAGRAKALDLADEDARAYEALNKLWKLPKDDPARAAFPAAVRAAIAAPEATLSTAKATLDALSLLVGTTSPSLASDLRIAIDLAEVAAAAAQENVRINLPSVADEAERAAIRDRSEGVLAAARTRAQDLRRRMAGG
jgi:formiminotetrahydrofolate cyclodeaminase